MRSPPLDRPIFAGQLRAGGRLPRAAFARYGAAPELIARIRQTANEWAEQLDRSSPTING